jgi:hypothetical protein
MVELCAVHPNELMQCCTGVQMAPVPMMQHLAVGGKELIHGTVATNGGRVRDVTGASMLGHCQCFQDSQIP